MKEDVTNPNRPCNICGSTTEKQRASVYTKDGKIRYIARCNECINKLSKGRNYTICSICGIDKKPSASSYCNECYNEKQRIKGKDYNKVVVGRELLRIKKYVLKAEKFNFHTDLAGLNELITLYMIICRSAIEYDNLSGGDQLQKMWEMLYEYYNQNIKDIPDEMLIRMTGTRYVKRRRPYKKSNNTNDVNSPKVCSFCGVEKMGSDFFFHVPGRLMSKCKQCCSEIKKEKYVSKFGVMKPKKSKVEKSDFSD